MNPISNGNISIKSWTRPISFDSENFISSYSKFIDMHKGQSILDFVTTLKNCSSCHLRSEARQVVLPEGNSNSDIIFVGRNAGSQEDLYGRPFYPGAPAARILNFYFQGLGVIRENVFITNACYCHSTRDRVPTPIELSTCCFWKHIEFSYLPNFKYIFLLGLEATQQFIGFDITHFPSVYRTLFQASIKNRNVLIIPVYHPGFIIRRQDLLPDVISYLSQVKGIIDLDRSNKLQWLI